MGELVEKIDKLHTTELGAERIKRNLNLKSENLVQWCKNAIINADLTMLLNKNWYVYFRGVVIVVNATSFTIITAHKISGKVRFMQESDYPCLKEFLYQAIFVPNGAELPSREIVNAPEAIVYIKDFGTNKGDLGVVAEQNGQIIGAAWTRIIPAYGHIDNDTPELAISILPEFRGYGIGTKLMKKLLALLKENDYERTSLSVHKENPALYFYKKLGYQIIDERHEDYLMVKDISQHEKR